MVGRQVLALVIGVQIPVPEQCIQDARFPDAKTVILRWPFLLSDMRGYRVF